MMALPDRYITASPINATFNYTDIEEGIGYVSYYLAQGTDENLVTRQNMASNGVVSAAQSADNPEWNTIFDDDYDVTFNTPKTMEGTILCSFTQGVQAVTGGKTSYSRVTVYIRKWDGSSETEIANNVSDEVSETGDTNPEIKSPTELLEIEVPQTNFKRGETLRITVLQEGKNQDTTTDAAIGYGHDPANREDDYEETGERQVINSGDTTVFRVDVPFKLFL